MNFGYEQIVATLCRPAAAADESFDPFIKLFGRDLQDLHHLRKLLHDFSIEPGIYLEGEFGIRSEINLHFGEAGAEVTTPGIQTEMYALLSDGWQSSSNL